MAESLITEVCGQRIALLSERCAFWVEEKILMASDLHWGKVEIFLKSGIPIPRKVFDDDLERLSVALKKTEAQRLLILGDLIHGVSGITPDLAEDLKKWRTSHSLQIDFIEGNHDRGVKTFLDIWNIHSLGSVFVKGPFQFSHDELEKSQLYTFSGHIHPKIHIQGRGRQSLKFPCFVVGKNRTILPAFSQFTGGQFIKPAPSDHIFAVTPEGVLQTSP